MSETVDQPTNQPTAKVTAATTAGAAAGASSILIVFIAGELGLDMSPEVGAAIATLLTTLFAFIGGYVKRERVVAAP
jgi:predicted anti-sigma-YlaC factor YlaD